MVRHIRSTVVMAGAGALLIAGLAAGVFAQQGQGGGPGGPGGRRGFGGPGIGGPGRPGGPGGPGGPMGMMGPGGLPLFQLDLTDTQREQVKGIFDRYQPDIQAAMKKERDAREAQRKAIETVPLNEALVRQAADALGAANAELAVLQARVHSEIYQLLTPDQQKKLQDLQAKRESMMEQRGQNVQKRLQNRQQKGKA